MSMWEGRQLERRTAARVAGSGFAPAINVVDPDTQSEFDIYAFLPGDGEFRRLMVQCSVSAPSSQKLAALKTYASSFGADDALYVTARTPHRAQISLAKKIGVALVSESDNSPLNSANIAGRTIDVQQSLSVQEKAIVAFMQCIARLRRVALDRRNESCAAEKVVEVLNELDRVALMKDPFERLSHLYRVHEQYRKLTQECALAENLASTARRACYRAYAYNEGTYTQSALAAQTLNRTHTLISYCECACLVAAGTSVPDEIASAGGRIPSLIEWLSRRTGRHLLALVAFEFVYGFGGLWSIMGQDVAPFIESATGATKGQIQSMKSYINHIFRARGMNEFIKQVEYQDTTWENLVFLPCFSKGIGLRRVELETGDSFCGSPWDDWRRAATDLVERCKEYQRNH